MTITTAEATTKAAPAKAKAKQVIAPISGIIFTTIYRDRNTSTDLEKLDNGASFTWGRPTQCFEVGPYLILESHPWKRKDKISISSGVPDESKLRYHVWVNGKDTSSSFASLDAALAGAIAYRNEGCNHSADHYFMKMLAVEKDEGND